MDPSQLHSFFGPLMIFIFFSKANITSETAAVTGYFFKHKYQNNKQKISSSFLTCKLTAVSWLQSNRSGVLGREERLVKKKEMP